MKKGLLSIALLAGLIVPALQAIYAPSLGTIATAAAGIVYNKIQTKATQTTTNYKKHLNNDKVKTLTCSVLGAAALAGALYYAGPSTYSLVKNGISQGSKLLATLVLEGIKGASKITTTPIMKGTNILDTIKGAGLGTIAYIMGKSVLTKPTLINPMDYCSNKKADPYEAKEQANTILI